MASASVFPQGHIVIVLGAVVAKNRIHSLFLFVAIVACCANSERIGDVCAAQQPAEKPAMAAEDAQEALSKLLEKDDFLPETAYLEPLTSRIRTENEKEPLLKARSGSSGPGGCYIGPWSYKPDAYTFSYTMKSKKRDELFIVHGRFVQGDDKKWRAILCETSRTKLTIPFGPEDHEKIKIGMTMGEVTKILGVPPGAYFTGVMGFTFPSGRRANWAFTGTREDFERSLSALCSPKSGEKLAERAWVSNDVAVFVLFDEDGKAYRIETRNVLCPNECTAAHQKGIQELYKMLKEKK